MWLREYLSTIKRAAGIRWYVLAIIVSGIVGRLDWLEEEGRQLFSLWLGVHVSEGDPTMIFGFPSWIVGLTVLFALLFLIVLQYAVRLDRKQNPGIKITFEDRRPWVRDVQTIMPSKADPNVGIKKPARWVRVKVENATPDTVVRGCEAYLERIMKEAGSGEFIEVTSGDSFRLPWSARPQDKIHAAISIPHGVHTFCDLLSVDGEWNELFVKWDVSLHANEGVVSDHGVYRFDVTVISERGGPVKESIFVEWKGVWDQIRCWKM